MRSSKIIAGTILALVGVVGGCIATIAYGALLNGLVSVPMSVFVGACLSSVAIAVITMPIGSKLISILCDDEYEEDEEKQNIGLCEGELISKPVQSMTTPIKEDLPQDKEPEQESSKAYPISPELLALLDTPNPVSASTKQSSQENPSNGYPISPEFLALLEKEPEKERSHVKRL